MQLKKIRPDRKRLADEVYEQLLDAIRGNRVGPDERLVQERLAEELHISRTPVREALLRLEQDGILKTSPRGGFVIHTMSDQEVRELYQARAAIEGQAVRILASQNDEKKNASLRATVEREENISNASVQAYFEANRNIHRAFVVLAENRYLLEMFDNIWNRAISYRIFAAIENVDLSNSLGDHMKLVESVETGDRTAALENIVEHITDGFDLQIKALGQQS